MGGSGLSLREAAVHLDGIVRSAQVQATSPDPVAVLAEALGPGPFAFVTLFASPEVHFPSLVNKANRYFGEAVVVGCTTAGELGRDGYSEGSIVAIGLPSSHFCVEPILIPDLEVFDQQDIVGQMIRTRTLLTAQCPGWTSEFAFLAIDGLSVREDEVAAAISAGLGPVPMFGGSAGDGDRFGQAYVSLNGTVHTHAAVLCFVRTACHVKVFSLDHLKPTDVRMVVTDADPKRRVVRKINAEPAAREYARLLGKDPEQLSTFTFASHPVVVRLGGTHHVRAIQRVHDNGDLVFFSAIDEGVVLTLAQPEDMSAHLARELGQIGRHRTPDAILACDCMLRRIEAEQNQAVTALSSILKANRVVGFSTYGEQLNGLHVNQTMTGVAIFAPDGE